MTAPKPAYVALAVLLAAGTAGCASGMSDSPPEPNPSLYDTWDTNRDSLLDTQEFAAGPYRAWYPNAHDNFDRDGDGFITDEELTVSPQYHADTGRDGAEWDLDRNGSIDEDELRDGAFADWDVDGDGALDRDEFDAGAYDAWDTDGDGMLSDEEFGAASEQWLGDSDIGDFASWDQDGSGTIDSAEFRAGLAG